MQFHLPTVGEKVKKKKIWDSQDNVVPDTAIKGDDHDWNTFCHRSATLLKVKQ